MMKYEKEKASDQHLPGEILDAFWRNVGKVVDFRMIAWNFLKTRNTFWVLDHPQAKFRGLQETLTSEEIEVR